eukprot:987117-Alexandrium_andersonii.AAC.1
MRSKAPRSALKPCWVSGEGRRAPARVFPFSPASLPRPRATKGSEAPAPRGAFERGESSAEALRVRG